MKPIIRVENLSKQYRIGAKKAAYGTLRDRLVEVTRSQIERLRPNSNSEEHTIWALHDVSFEVQPGVVLGIVGRNGAGKSTLLKILSRVTEPTIGQVDIFGRVGSLLEVGTGFHGELSGRENIFLNGAILGMKRIEILKRFDEIVEFAETGDFIDTPVKHYSTGMYMRLAFAVAAHLETEVLLVDEVLAVGDSAFQRKCMGKMGDVAKTGRTVVFVSHSLDAVSRLCDNAILLENGSLAAHGTTAEVVDRYYSKALSGAGYSEADHVLYENLDPTAHVECAITKIESLDKHGRPKPRIATWDDVRLRIWYSSSKYLKSGSVVIRLAAIDGRQVALLSTMPDSTLAMTFEPGTSYVDCLIHKIPLSAGAYILGAGLAVPNLLYLWTQDDLGILMIDPKDVYESGLPPAATRTLTAIDHVWFTPASQ